MPELVDELLGHPSACFLRRLAIGALGTPDEYNFTGVVDAIARRGHPRLEELALGEFGPEMDLAFSRAGNVAPLLDAPPRLRGSTLRAGSLRVPNRRSATPSCASSVVVATIMKAATCGGCSRRGCRRSRGSSWRARARADRGRAGADAARARDCLGCGGWRCAARWARWA